MEQTKAVSKHVYYNTEWFRRVAPVYDLVEWIMKRARSQAVKKLGLREESKVLEVACGTGSLSLALAKRGYTVTGVDLSPHMLQRAIQKAKNYPGLKMNFIEGDASALSFPDTHFDASIVSLGIHDMPYHIGEKVLSEMIRVTKTQGVVAIFDYNANTSLGAGLFQKLAHVLVKTWETNLYDGYMQGRLIDMAPLQGLLLEREEDFYREIFKLWVYKKL